MRAVALLVPLLACSKSGEVNAYKKVAELANPIFTKLRPTAIRITALDPSSGPTHSQIIELCGSMDSELETLMSEKVAFGDLGGAPGGSDSMLDVPTTARQIVLGRLGLCGDPNDTRLCAEYCSGRWKHLVEGVDQLNERGAKVDVKFVELR